MLKPRTPRCNESKAFRFETYSIVHSDYSCDCSAFWSCQSNVRCIVIAATLRRHAACKRPPEVRTINMNATEFYAFIVKSITPKATSPATASARRPDLPAARRPCAAGHPAARHALRHPPGARHWPAVGGPAAEQHPDPVQGQRAGLPEPEVAPVLQERAGAGHGDLRQALCFSNQNF